MKKPVLVIMAAGMGSRYGGLKQIDPVDGHGHIIIDFSIYDAIRAGFEKIVFIIKKADEQEFREAIGNRMEKRVDVSYVFQELERLPAGYEVPDGRVKPYGTAHAVLCCKGVVDAPFAVINADDFYGRHAFEKIYNYLMAHQDDEKYRYTMVGYILENTLTEHGHVARGICQTNADHQLVGITERTRIEKHGDVSVYTEDDGATWHELEKGCTVSMNMWGFTPSFLDELEARFPQFLAKNLVENPLKCEFFLPTVVGELIAEDKAAVEVLESADRWYGVTYHEDKQVVMDAVAKMRQEGIYPEILWEE